MQQFDLMNNFQHLLAYIALCIVRVFDQVDLPVFHGTYCLWPYHRLRSLYYWQFAVTLYSVCFYFWINYVTIV